MRDFHRNRTGIGKLAAAVLLKLFQFNGHFPRYHRVSPLRFWISLPSSSGLSRRIRSTKISTAAAADAIASRSARSSGSALLSAYCWQRRRELIDGLVDLLILIIHRLSVRAEKRITTEMPGELKHVEDKTGTLVRFRVVAGGGELVGSVAQWSLRHG